MSQSRVYWRDTSNLTIFFPCACDIVPADAVSIQHYFVTIPHSLQFLIQTESKYKENNKDSTTRIHSKIVMLENGRA